MLNVYDKFHQTFKDVSSFALIHDGEPVGKVAIKHGKTGRVTAFVHLSGFPMVTAFADGGDYDKVSTAIHEAIDRHNCGNPDTILKDFPRYYDGLEWRYVMNKIGIAVFQTI